MPTDARRSRDPLALLHLLWTPDTRVGRSGATLGSVVEAAIGLADAEGLAAVSMRALAARVGVGTMTLYGYVPGRTELVELMLDTVVARTYTGQVLPGEFDDWRDGLRHIATRNHAHALQHGWTVDVPPSRPILGPGNLLKYEAELAPLDGIGLDDLTMDQALTHVLALVQHAARWQHSMQRAREESTLADEQWWEIVGPQLAARLGADPLPVAGRVGESVASAGDPAGFLRRGVDTIVADLERRVPGHHPGSAVSRPEQRARAPRG